MGVAERRTREKERRKNEIIDAAERIFFSKGFENATMDQVAEAAELSKGLLYFYFKSKDDLQAAISLRAIRILQQLFQKAVSEEEKGIDKIGAIGRACINYGVTYSNYFWALAQQVSREPNPDPTSFAAMCDMEGDKVLYIVADAIRAGITDGSIRADINPDHVAVILWGQTHGLVQIAMLKDIQERFEVTIDTLAEEFISLTRTALSCPEGGAVSG